MDKTQKRIKYYTPFRTLKLTGNAFIALEDNADFYIENME